MTKSVSTQTLRVMSTDRSKGGEREEEGENNNSLQGKIRDHRKRGQTVTITKRLGLDPTEPPSAQEKGPDSYNN